MAPLKVQELERSKMGARSLTNQHLELHSDQRVYLAKTSPVVFYMEMKSLMDRNWEFTGNIGVILYRIIG